MPNKRKRDKRKKNKGKKGSSGSSTPQSSTPSVEDDKQQLLQGGACEYSSVDKPKKDSQKTGLGKLLVRSISANSPRRARPVHSSRDSLISNADPGIPRRHSMSPFRRILEAFSPDKKSPSRSSDPKCRCTDKINHEPECPGVKNLAACAKEKYSKGNLKKRSSSESKKSSSSESRIILTSQDCTQSSSSSDPSVPEYSRNASALQHPGGRPHLAPKTGSSSSPMKSTGARAKTVLMGRSPNPSSDTETSWEDKSDPMLECSERRKNEKGAKNKYLKSKSPNRVQTMSETSSSSRSPSISKKNDPSVPEYSRDASALQHPGRLPHPAPKTGSSSSPMKSTGARPKTVLMGRSPNPSSDTETSWEDKSDPMLECSKRRKNEKGAKNKYLKSRSPNRGQTKSETSSSSRSPSISKKNYSSDISNVSSEISKNSNSKSSSSSDSNAVKSCPDQANKSSECSSDSKILIKSESELARFRNPKDSDPQEGTSRGPVRHEQYTSDQLLTIAWRRYGEEELGEPIDEGMVPIVEHDPEEEGKELQNPNPLVPRLRSISFKSTLPQIRLETSRSPSPPRLDLPESVQSLESIDWPWFEKIKKKNRSRNANAQRDPTRDNPADEFERQYIRHLAVSRRSRPVRRHESSSPERKRPCDCIRGPYWHKPGCPEPARIARKIRQRKCWQDEVG